MRNGSNTQSEVKIAVVDSQPQVINPNGIYSHLFACCFTDNMTGGTNYKGQIVFAGEGQGENIPSALYLMNPKKPYNTTGETQLRNMQR